MGYQENFLKFNKRDMKYFMNNIEKYKEVFEEYGVRIYCSVKLLKPLSFECEYQIGIENEDLPVGEYIWIGGERRGHVYAFEESPELQGLRNI